MNQTECPEEKELRFKRIRRLKRWMRPLPRRSNIHNYPVLKWFSATAYKRSYLWSFKGDAMKPALFLGDGGFLFSFGWASNVNSVLSCLAITGQPSCDRCLAMDFESINHGANLLC